MFAVEQHVGPATEPEPEAEPPYATELAALSVKLLKRRAKAMGATPEQIEGIYQAADVKAAALELALTVRAALDGMNQADLRVRLRAMGVTEDCPSSRLKKVSHCHLDPRRVSRRKRGLNTQIRALALRNTGTK